MPLLLSTIWGDVPVGDLASVHPDSAIGYFHVDVPAGGTTTIRHQIMTSLDTNDPTITDLQWMCLMTPIFSWDIISIDFDVTLEVLTNITAPLAPSHYKSFLLKVGVHHLVESLYVPTANAQFILHNSSGAATAEVEGFIRMRAL